MTPIDTHTKEEVLVKALPYIQTYEGKTFVIKYGGAAMTDDQLKSTFAKDVTVLRKIGINIIIVHGGGKEITDLASRLNLQTRFVDGQRYTDSLMLDAVLMVLAGKLNKEIVNLINTNSGNAVGLTGMDNMLLRGRRAAPGGNDLGLVGEISTVNTAFLNSLLTMGLMPVIAPLAMGENGEMLNTNADIAASAIASALKAEKLVYLSDIEGVMVDGTLVSTLSPSRAEQLIHSSAITGGMIPKVRSAFHTVDAGVHKVHIIDGRIKHSLLLEIFTDEGIGTQLVPEDEAANSTS